MFFAKIVNEARMSGKYVQKSDSQRNPRKALRRIAGSAPTKSTWMPHSISAHISPISPIWPASARISPLLTAPPGRSPGGMARSTAYRRAPPLPEHPGTRTSRRHAGTGRGSHRAPGQRFALAQHRQHAQVLRLRPDAASVVAHRAVFRQRGAHAHGVDAMAARHARAAGSRPVRVRQTLRPRRAPGTAIQTDGRAHAGCRGSLRRLGHDCVGACTKCWEMPCASARSRANSRFGHLRGGQVGFGQMHHGILGRAAQRALQSEATAASYRPSGRLKRASMVSAAPSMSLRAAALRERRKYAAQANTMKAWV